MSNAGSINVVPTLKIGVHTRKARHSRMPKDALVKRSTYPLILEPAGFKLKKIGSFSRLQETPHWVTICCLGDENPQNGYHV